MHPDVANALRECRRALWSIALFSGATNVLMLAGPLYMLQIYDRVLSSRSVPTLIAFSIFLLAAYAFQGAFDIIRTRIVVRGAALLDHYLGTTVHNAVLRLAVRSRNASEPYAPVRDLDQIRAFLTGTGPAAMADLPWMPVFLAICFLIHPWLGAVALTAAIILFAVAILTERASRAPARAVSEGSGVRSGLIEATRRNSETIVAMGMVGALAQRWNAANSRYLAAIGRSSDLSSSYSSLSKVFRLFMQSAILGTGAYLVIEQQLTSGSMIAASIMMGRALAPIETVIANWRTFIAARQSARRLSQTLARLQKAPAATALPKPSDSLDVEQLAVAAPGAQTLILGNVQFRLAGGECLGIIGPSGVGKTSLVRTLLGIWPSVRGSVRLDGATLDQWDPEVLGRHIGYLSQGVELFDGSISENIARMDAAADSAAIIAAAQAAGAHEMILRQLGGYDTRIGDAGMALSAGQRQRIALARALYGDPFAIVLDEPNSNLDTEGENALFAAIESAKARGAIVLIIAHRRSVLAVCDKVLVLANGAQQAFGPRDEVLRGFVTGPLRVANAPHLKVAEAGGGG
ncbi:MAG TPA: type I secretion system permease/ATPase [Pseudolabrys sp.]|nr:type I secretion system permease/ATPase [Pseudolabrys sp.]